jgi:hypothetical protein
MLRTYLRGVRAALRCWPVAVCLWLINAAFGVLFALASGFWLTIALDRSLATRSLLRHLDAGVFIDLYHHHWEGFAMLLAVGALLALVYLGLSLWLHGVVVAAVRAPSGTPLGELFRRGVNAVGVFARIYLVAAGALLAVSAAIGATAWAGLRWTVTSPSPYVTESIAGAAAGVWVLCCVFLVAVHDHARIRARAAAEGALAAYRWAVAFVLRGGERAFLLALLLQATAFALWAGYHLLALREPLGAVLDVTGSLVWGEMFLLVRVGVRLWFFAAESELQG